MFPLFLFSSSPSFIKLINQYLLYKHCYRFLHSDINDNFCFKHQEDFSRSYPVKLKNLDLSGTCQNNIEKKLLCLYAEPITLAQAAS